MNSFEIRNRSTGVLLFAAHELACPSTGEIRLAAGFSDQLETLRRAMDEAMRANSVCRSPAHNQAKGGVNNSFHLTRGNLSDGCCAIDVHVPDSIYRLKLARLAAGLDWTVGVYPTFLHLDRRYDFGLEPIMFYGG